MLWGIMVSAGLYLRQNQLSGEIHTVFQFLCYENTVPFFFPIRISISSFKSLLEKSREILPTCTQIWPHLPKQWSPNSLGCTEMPLDFEFIENVLIELNPFLSICFLPLPESGAYEYPLGFLLFRLKVAPN